MSIGVAEVCARYTGENTRRLAPARDGGRQLSAGSPGDGTGIPRRGSAAATAASERLSSSRTLVMFDDAESGQSDHPRPFAPITMPRSR